MQQEQAILAQLFRSEFGKITAVLSKTFGLAHVEIAEDIVSDTFLLASQTWGLKGIPENPAAWLYTVAKNKTRDYLKRENNFSQNITPAFQYENTELEINEPDFSEQGIQDSQLQMVFAVCHPSIAPEAQMALALRILCGFGVDEIADAFLSNKETINKRMFRAKEKLRTENVELTFPSRTEVKARTDSVLHVIYLLFNEGYHSSNHISPLRKELCTEALRLALMLSAYKPTALPETNALIALICFHASRFEARSTDGNELIGYEEQDKKLWNVELLAKGEYYMNLAAVGSQVSTYHLEAAIAYWHTQSERKEKWEKVLQLYNHLLQINYSPMAALNRTYALSKVYGSEKAIVEALRINLNQSHWYHVLLAHLYESIDAKKSQLYYQQALQFAKSESEKNTIQQKLKALIK